MKFKLLNKDTTPRPQQINVRFREDLFGQLMVLSEEQRLPMNEIIRQMVTHCLEELKDDRKGA